MPSETEEIELRRFALDVASRLKFFETSTDPDGNKTTSEKSISAVEVLAAARGFEKFLREG